MKREREGERENGRGGGGGGGGGGKAREGKIKREIREGSGGGELRVKGRTCSNFPLTYTSMWSSVYG